MVLIMDKIKTPQPPFRGDVILQLVDDRGVYIP